MGEPCFVGECGQEMEGTGRKVLIEPHLVILK